MSAFELMPEFEPAPFPEDEGTIVTFYSYKGGVGRSMALANCAAMLARMGKRVLVVDWDLEAPGIEKYFREAEATISKGSQRVDPNGGIDRGARSKTPGIVDLLCAWRDQTKEGPEGAARLYDADALPDSLDWRRCILTATPFRHGEGVSVLTAGQETLEYVTKLQSLDWTTLFEKHQVGLYLERLRNEWRRSFDFVLIDSRTGLSDSGSVCTALFPDQLVVVFTATDQGLDGVQTAIASARRARARLTVPRTNLLVVPVPGRDEPYMEKELSDQWRAKYAERFREMIGEWAFERDPEVVAASAGFGKASSVAPSKSQRSAAPAADEGEDVRIPPTTVLVQLAIPYASYWSFGEHLPVLDPAERQSPGKLGSAYGRLATLLASGLDWSSIESSTASPANAFFDKVQAYAAKAQEDLDSQRVGLEKKLASAAAARRNTYGVVLLSLAVSAIVIKITLFPSESSADKYRRLLASLTATSDAQTAIKLSQEIKPVAPEGDRSVFLALQKLGVSQESRDPDSAVPIFTAALDVATAPRDRFSLYQQIGDAWYDANKPRDQIAAYQAALAEAKKANLASESEQMLQGIATANEVIGELNTAWDAWKELVDLRCGKASEGGVKTPSPQCVKTRCDFVRFLMRNYHSGKEVGMFDPGPTATQIMEQLLKGFGQESLLTDPLALDFSAVGRNAASLSEILRTYEVYLRTLDKNEAADTIRSHVEKLQAFSDAPKAAPAAR